MKGPSSIIFACLISRTHFIARRRHRSRQSQSWSQLRVALPSSRTQICRGAVTSHPAFRFSRRALITGVPGERNERRVKERKKKKKERKRGREKDRLSTPTLQLPLRVCARVHVYVTWLHTRDRCDRGGKYVGVRGAFRRMPAPIAGQRHGYNCDRVMRACAHNAPRPAALYRRIATETRRVRGRL